MYIEKQTISLTTDGSGAATGYSEVVTGRVLAVLYTKVDFATGVDLTITAEGTGQAILTLTNQDSSGIWYPRAQVHGATGSGLTFDGTNVVAEPVPVVNERIKVVVAQGGSGKTGTVQILVG